MISYIQKLLISIAKLLQLIYQRCYAPGSYIFVKDDLENNYNVTYCSFKNSNFQEEIFQEMQETDINKTTR